MYRASLVAMVRGGQKVLMEVSDLWDPGEILDLKEHLVYPYVAI